MVLNKVSEDKMIDVAKVAGWVEVIVKDKDGKIKYHVGSPSPKEQGKCEDGHNCSLETSLPAKFLDYYWRKNIITNVGLACIIRLVFSGLTEDKFGYLAIGTGTTAESATDTALQAEVKRKLATITQVTTTIEGDTAKLEAEFSSADDLSGTMSISEAGIFNASTGGDLLARKVFPAVPLNFDAGDSIIIRYYVQMSR
jgi:hypothetical protein